MILALKPETVGCRAEYTHAQPHSLVLILGQFSSQCSRLRGSSLYITSEPSSDSLWGLVGVLLTVFSNGDVS